MATLASVENKSADYVIVFPSLGKEWHVILEKLAHINKPNALGR
jgi:hypothetical protein